MSAAKARSAISVPIGYGNRRVTLEALAGIATWAKLHPEFRQRIENLMVAAGGSVGIGTGWRSSDVQRALFLQRHVPSSKGTIRWNGTTWARLPGTAPAAPPGRSFHEGINDGTAMAIDLVGDIDWAGVHAAEFSLQHFGSVNNEPWHFQCAELPRGALAWARAGRPQPDVIATRLSRVAPVAAIRAKARTSATVTTPSPAAPTAARPRAGVKAPRPVTPTMPAAGRPKLRRNDRGQAVVALQELLIRAGVIKDNPANRDGDFGPGLEAALRRFQTAHQLESDGICGPNTWKALGG